MNINDFIVSEHTMLIEAMDKLDKVSKKILFVVCNNKFCATITDGDIRRWILRKGRLETTISEVANYSPRFLFENQKYKVKEYMKDEGIEAVPILDDNKEIVSITFIDHDEIANRKKIEVPVVIMAGGLGTRLYPYTKILPKALIPIGEIPIIEHIVNKFTDCGCSKFYMIVNHKKNMIKAYFNDTVKSYETIFIDEDKPLGTGGGLSLLKNQINETFFLTNCDILINESYEKMINFHDKTDNLITMICSLKTITIPYGIIEIDQQGCIENMKEKPELTFFINTGMYIVNRRIIEELEDDEEIGFPDIIEKYRKKGEKVGVYPISENSWQDMGQLEELEDMRRKIEGNLE